MPKYIYECLSCKEIFEVRHGMAERVDNCVECGKGEIQKRISDFSLGKTKETNSEKPAGTEVKKFIEETKEEIKGERETLSSRIIE